TAHRLLLQRKEGFEVAALEEMAKQAALAESRVRAMWLLQSLNHLKPELLEAAVADQHPGVREQAIMLGAPLWKSNQELLPLLVQASADKELRVRFAAALMLGELQHKEAGEALARIAAENGDDKWIRAAVLSGVGNRLQEFLEMFRSSPSPDQEAFAAVMQDLGRLFGNAASVDDSRQLFRDVIKDRGDLGWRAATVLGLVEGFSARLKIAAPQQSPLAALLGDGTPEEFQELNAFVEEIREMALNNNHPLRTRMNATTLLGYASFDQVAPALGELLDARNAPEIQLAAVSSLSRLGDSRGGELLASKQVWAQYTPRVKAAAIQAMVSNPVYL